MDHDSVETDTASVHIDLDRMVTSVCLGLDGMIKFISRFFSSYTECQPLLFKSRFWSGTGEDNMACMAA
jgi:hypothetical protein